MAAAPVRAQPQPTQYRRDRDGDAARSQIHLGWRPGHGVSVLIQISIPRDLALGALSLSLCSRSGALAAHLLLFRGRNAVNQSARSQRIEDLVRSAAAPTFDEQRIAPVSQRK